VYNPYRRFASSGDIAEGWATYFERLSKSLEGPDFNEEYKQFVEADYDQILEYCSTDSQPGEFTTIEILAEITGQQKSGFNLKGVVMVFCFVQNFFFGQHKS
jgi:hypothetical protein